jgi:TP901 family phage tail tape measure protein
MGKSMRGLDKIGKKVASTGRRMTMVATVPLVAFGVLAVKTTADFEFSMNKVLAKTNATGEEFAEMTELAKKLGETTRFSARESAQGMDFLAMAGFKTQEILGSLPGTLQLAAASSITLAEAADISTNILTAFGLKTKDIAHLNDVMAQAMASANFNMLEIGESMTYVAGTAKSMGVPVMETTKILGLLANAGVKGSRAGVALANVMTKLITPSNKAIEILQGKGLQFGDVFTAEGKFKDLTKTLLHLNKAGITLPEMKEVFGQRAVKTFAGIFGKDMQRNVDAINTKMSTFEGAAGRMEDIMMRGLPGALVRLKSAFEGMLLKFTGKSGLGENVELVVNKLIKFVNWVGNLSPAALKTVAVIGLLVSVLGPLLFIIGQLVIGLAALPHAIAAIGAGFAFLLTPAGLITVAVLALIWAGWTLVHEWEMIRDFWIGIFMNIVDFFVGIWQSIPKGFRSMIVNILTAFNPMLIMFRLLLKYKDALATGLKWILPKGIERKLGLTTGEESFAGIEPNQLQNQSEFKGVLRIENAPARSTVEVEQGGLSIETDTGLALAGVTR